MMDLSRYDNSGFSRGASALKEACWLALSACLFRCWAGRANTLRAALLRAFGAGIGRCVDLKPRVQVTFPWRLTIGDHCWIGDETLILTLAPVTIGSNVCISQRAFLCTGNHDWADPAFALHTAPITIGDGAWVGANAFIGPGVTIGDGAVVTAGSVVTRDLPGGMICSGNPCVPVKPRKMKVPATGGDTV